MALAHTMEDSEVVVVLAAEADILGRPLQGPSMWHA